MKNKVIAICYTPFQLNVISHLIEQEKISEDSIVLNYTKDNYSKFHNLIDLSTINIKSLLFYFVIRFRFKKFISIHKTNHFLIPHSDGVLVNFIISKFFSKIKISLYHEGVLSFYSLTGNTYKKNKRKEFLSKIIFNHRFVYGNFFPIDKSLFFYFPFNKKFTHVENEKIIDFKFNFKQFKKNKENSLLFLGKPSYKSPKKIIQFIRNLKNEENIEIIYQKSHPSSRFNFNFDFFDSSVTLKNSIAVEDLVVGINPHTILSCGISSALINFGISNPEKKFILILDSNEEEKLINLLDKIFKENLRIIYL